MNPLNFVAVILKVLLVNLLAALNFANVLKIKKRLENKKNVKNVTIIKNVQKRFHIYDHRYNRSLVNKKIHQTTSLSGYRIHARNPPVYELL